MSAPRRIGKFDVVRLLATGGMGEVFLARQQGAGGFSRAVVVKQLLPHLARDASFVQMFLNEGRLAGMLAHPNIAQVYELGESGGSYFLALEYVHGKSLKHVERALAGARRLLGPPLAARICIDALRGLQAAHVLMIDGRRSAVVHRDMSPDNILVGFNGVARVIDFGIARAADAASTTQTGTLKGKFAYMAPERFAAEKGDVDPRVDLYAMAVVLYEALCGRRPFVGQSDAALVGAILNERSVPPSAVNPLLDEALSSLIMRGLERDPAARWPSAEAFAQALEDWLEQTGQPTPHTAVAGFMRALFGDIEADSNPSLTRGALTPAEGGGTGVTQARARSRRRLAVVAGAALITAAAGGVWGARLLSVPPAAVAPVAAPTPVAPLPAAVVPAAEPARKKGRVAFRVKPWGEIWQGDQKLGVTPNVSVELPAGRQTFTVKNPRYPPRELAVEVLPDTEVSVKVDLTGG